MGIILYVLGYSKLKYGVKNSFWITSGHLGTHTLYNLKKLNSFTGLSQLYLSTLKKTKYLRIFYLFCVQKMGLTFLQTKSDCRRRTHAMVVCGCAGDRKRSLTDVCTCVHIHGR
jgi:hypothetical protein